MSQSYADAQESTFHDTTFRVRMLDPLDALDLEVDILKTLGPALASVVSGLLKSEDTGAALSQLMDGVQNSRGGDGDKEVSLSALGESLDEEAQDALGDLLGDSIESAVGGLIDRLSKQQLREVVKKMESVTSVKSGDNWPELSSAGVASKIFRGRLKLLHKWLAFAIRVQYRDFFEPA